MNSEELKEHLKSLTDHDQVSHAYILEGDRETCFEIAKTFAGGLISTPADLIIPEQEKPQLFSVGDVRTGITQTIYIRPYGEGKKVYIIREADKMNQQAQNALLKTIEEPPAYAVLLLIAENSEVFLETILSRCVLLRVSGEETEAQEEEKEAVALTRQLFREGRDLNMEKILKYAAGIAKYRPYAAGILEYMRSFFRDALVLKCGGSVNMLLNKGDQSAVRLFSERISLEGADRILKRIDEAQRRADANVNFELAMEYLWLGIQEEL